MEDPDKSDADATSRTRRPSLPDVETLDIHDAKRLLWTSPPHTEGTTSGTAPTSPNAIKRELLGHALSTVADVHVSKRAPESSGSGSGGSGSGGAGRPPRPHMPARSESFVAIAEEDAQEGAGTAASTQETKSAPPSPMPQRPKHRSTPDLGQPQRRSRGHQRTPSQDETHMGHFVSRGGELVWEKYTPEEQKLSRSRGSSPSMSPIDPSIPFNDSQSKLSAEELDVLIKLLLSKQGSTASAAEQLSGTVTTTVSLPTSMGNSPNSSAILSPAMLTHHASWHGMLSSSSAESSPRTAATGASDDLQLHQTSRAPTSPRNNLGADVESAWIVLDLVRLLPETSPLKSLLTSPEINLKLMHMFHENLLPPRHLEVALCQQIMLTVKRTADRVRLTEHLSQLSPGFRKHLQTSSAASSAATAATATSGSS